MQRTRDGWDWVRFLEMVLRFGRFPFPSVSLPSRTPQGYNASHCVAQLRTDDRYIDNSRKETVIMQPQKTIISAMLAVSDTPVAVEWYQRALGATVLWSLGAVAGLEIAGAPFFLGQPENNGWESPSKLGITSTRVEVFCDDPDTMIARALEAGATSHNDLRNHQAPWGTHRQGSFTDPFGHIWLVGDKSPLNRYPS
jgi:PhnB protein